MGRANKISFTFGNVIPHGAEHMRKDPQHGKRHRTIREKMQKEAAQLSKEAQLRARQTTLPHELEHVCEQILEGVKGCYYLFGLAIKVRDHTIGHQIVRVLKLEEALPETDIFKKMTVGTAVPILTLRMNPEKLQWRFVSEEALSVYFHANSTFREVALKLRRKHFEMMQASKQHQRTSEAA